MLELGKAIQIVRQAKRVRLGDLAKSAKVSIAFLSLIEASKRQPSLDALRRIAAALDVPPEALIILAQPTNGTLVSNTGDATGVADAIRKLVVAEDSLRESLDIAGKRVSRGKR